MDGEEQVASPLFSDYIYQSLDNALDYGISEQDFWNMTFAEIKRAIASKVRINKIQAQERASFDYILADLIGKSIARIHAEDGVEIFPRLEDAYPTLFDDLPQVQEREDKLAEAKDELSALRFRLFATSHNEKLKEVAKE